MWKLEMIFDNERPAYVADRLDFVRRAFPHVQEITHSTCYVIAGCQRTTPLSEDEKALLSSWIEQKVIQRFRCKRL